MVAYANILQPLITVFEAVLKFFHNTVGVGWGLSIVLMTIVVRAALIPLTLKQFHSMQELARHQPELKAIQQRYKEDKERQQQEMMKFYRENKINPLASCLPLAAQLPVFISLFYMLRKDLRINICPDVQLAAHHVHNVAASQTVPCGRYGQYHNAGFLFIHDLTNVATGATLAALVVLYVGTQLGATLVAQTPTMDKNQRRIMLALPLLFVLFILRFPAGLLVYWITTNAWTIVQQYIVKKRVGTIAPVPVPVAGGGSGGAAASANGGGSPGSGLMGLLRGRSATETPGEVATVPSARAGGPPPRPPRKKKKRSGRRR